MEMEFDIEIFAYAIKQNTEIELLDMWRLRFNNVLQLEEFVPYEKFKENMLSDNNNNQHTKITYEDIETEMAKVEKAFAEKDKSLIQRR